MMRPLGRALVLLAALMAGAEAAYSQTDPRTAVSANVGLGTGASDTGLTLGGALLFDVTQRVSVEGQGTYLQRGDGAEAFTLGASVLVNLLPAGDSLVPYAAAGFGMYRASFELANQRFFGASAGQFGPGSTLCAAPGTGVGFGPGPGFGAGSGSCPNDTTGYLGVGELPHFYARRLGPLGVPTGTAWDTRTFTDPVVNLGGGVRMHLSERVMLRPDARALLVLADGETHTVGVFSLHLAYRF